MSIHLELDLILSQTSGNLTSSTLTVIRGFRLTIIGSLFSQFDIYTELPVDHFARDVVIKVMLAANELFSRMNWINSLKKCTNEINGSSKKVIKFTSVFPIVC